VGDYDGGGRIVISHGCQAPALAQCHYESVDSEESTRLTLYRVCTLYPFRKLTFSFFLSLFSAGGCSEVQSEGRLWANR